MKHLIAIALLAASGLASAQNTQPPATPASAPEAAPLPKCWPKPIGTGTKLRTASSELGTWAWWYCSNKVMYDPQFVVVSKLSYSSSTFFNDMALVLASPTPTTALNELWTAKVKLSNPAVPVELYQRAGVDMFSNYFVPLNGTLKTRPTHTSVLVDGKLNPAVTGSIAVGAPCNCNVFRHVEGRQYCAVNAQDLPSYTPAAIAICEPKL